MDEVKTPTIEDIDTTMAANQDRLEKIAGTLESLDAELGETRGLKASTAKIHGAIERLENERRELEAEQRLLKGKRKLILETATQKAAQDAAAEYESLCTQLTPRAKGIISDLVSVQSQLIELEKIQSLMNGQALVAGKLVQPAAFTGAIILDTLRIANHITQALQYIAAFNGENIGKAGIRIPGFDEERQKSLRVDARFE